VMLCSGVAVHRLLSQQSSMRPAVMAGHSLGEYAALVAAGVMSLGDGTRLVAERGRLMQQAVPAGTGAMAAVLGLDDDAVRTACSEAAQGQVVEAVNFNSPGQVVIAGHAEAVDRAVELAREAGARRAVLLDVSVPSHCALMRPAAEHLAAAIRAIELAPPRTPVLHNTSVDEARDAESIAEALVAQLYSPVRWVETVTAIGARGVTSLVEAGPGKVLTGLARRIDKSMTGLPVLDPATLDLALEAIHA
jgi:[acyl-carrier-protein] S-malonyltransferase